MSYQNEQNNQQYPSSGQSGYQGRRVRRDPVDQGQSGGYYTRNAPQYGAQQRPQNYGARQPQRPQNYGARQPQQRPQNYPPRQRQQYPDNFDAPAPRQRNNVYYDRGGYSAGGYDDRARRRVPQQYDHRGSRQPYYDDRGSGRSPRGRKPKKKTSKVIVVVRVVAILLLLVGLGIIGFKLYGYYAAGKAHDALADRVSNKSLEEYQRLHAENNDFFGWLEIPDAEDTSVDYPVMYTPYDPEKYLHMNFDGGYSESGELFIDADCDTNGYHYLIYGHHMNNGSMFGSLPKFEDYSFYQDHHTVFFDTCEEKGTYEIFAVFYSQIYDEDDDVFKYYECANLNDEATYNYYVENVKALSIYDIDITPQYGEKIVTLSTCNYHTSDGRFVICAKKV